MPRRRLKTKVKCILVLFLTAAFITSAVIYYDIKLRPVVREVATSTAGDYATEIINDTVYDVLENNNVNYEDIVDLQKDNDGNIIALTINTVKVNRLRTEIALALSRRTNEVNGTQIKVPLGNFFSSGFFSNKGPGISLSILPTSSIYTDIEQEFSDAGINQTVHKISFKATVDFNLIFPTEIVSEKYTSQILVAQTVIVGKVPSTYAEIGAKDAMSYIQYKNILTG